MVPEKEHPTSFPGAWHIQTIEECTEKIIDYRGKTPRKTGSGVPLITAKIVKHGRIEEPSEFIASDEYVNWMRRGLPEKGDVLLTTEAPLGEVAQITDAHVALAQRIILLRGRKQYLDNSFLKYSLLSDFVQSQLHSRVSGTTVTGIKQSELRKVVIPLPPISEQKAIARILSSLDDKIELNRRMNATLEQMAQALFRAWFVDFEPVKAKAAGLQPASADAQTAALFPSELVESELGLIPKGWGVQRLSEVFDIVMGQSPPGETYNVNGEGLAFFQGRADFGFRYPMPRVYCTAPTRLARNGSTLLSVRAPVGDVNIATEDCCIGRGVASLRHKRNCLSFGYYLLQNMRPRLDNFNSEGTVFGAINKASLQGLQIITPSDRVLDFAEPTLSRIDRQIKNNSEQSQTLTQLRDTLLPRLISGRLRVPEAMREVDAA